MAKQPVTPAKKAATAPQASGRRLSPRTHKTPIASSSNPLVSVPQHPGPSRGSTIASAKSSTGAAAPTAQRAARTHLKHRWADADIDALLVAIQHSVGSNKWPSGEKEWKDVREAWRSLQGYSSDAIPSIPAIKSFTRSAAAVQDGRLPSLKATAQLHRASPRPPVSTENKTGGASSSATEPRTQSWSTLEDDTLVGLFSRTTLEGQPSLTRASQVVLKTWKEQAKAGVFNERRAAQLTDRLKTISTEKNHPHHSHAKAIVTHLDSAGSSKSIARSSRASASSSKPSSPLASASSSQLAPSSSIHHTPASSTQSAPAPADESGSDDIALKPSTTLASATSEQTVPPQLPHSPADSTLPSPANVEACSTAEPPAVGPSSSVQVSKANEELGTQPSELDGTSAMTDNSDPVPASAGSAGLLQSESRDQRRSEAEHSALSGSNESQMVAELMQRMAAMEAELKRKTTTETEQAERIAALEMYVKRHQSSSYVTEADMVAESAKIYSKIDKIADKAKEAMAPIPQHAQALFQLLQWQRDVEGKEKERDSELRRLVRSELQQQRQGTGRRHRETDYTLPRYDGPSRSVYDGTTRSVNSVRDEPRDSNPFRDDVSERGRYEKRRRYSDEESDEELRPKRGSRPTASTGSHPPPPVRRSDNLDSSRPQPSVPHAEERSRGQRLVSPEVGQWKAFPSQERGDREAEHPWRGHERSPPPYHHSEGSRSRKSTREEREKARYHAQPR